MIEVDDYIPVELWHEAKRFVQEVTDDVDIYKVICKTVSLKPCDEADRFCAYWNIGSYEMFPHALITLYENKSVIDDRFIVNDVMNSFECLQERLKNYYLLLKEKGMIE